MHPRKLDRGKAAVSFLWSALENAALNAVSFASIVVYARVLSPADFGLFAILLSITEVLAILPNMIFHDALVQRKEASDAHFNTAFCSTLAMSLALMVCCFLFASKVGASLSDQRASVVFCCLAITLPISALSATIVARQRRELEFKLLATRSLVSRLLGVLSGISCGFLGFGIWSLVVQQMVTAILSSSILWITSNARPTLKFDADHFKQLAQFGLPSIAALFINFSMKRLFIFITGIYVGTIAAGYVNIAFRATDTLWAVSASAISQVALPILSSVQRDLEKLKVVYFRFVAVACVVLFPIFAGVGLLSDEVIHLLFGEKWIPAAPFVTILSFMIIFQAPKLLIPPILSSVGRPRDILLANVLGGAFLGLVIYFSGLQASATVVAAWASYEAFSLIVFSIILRNALGWSFWEQFKPVVAPMLATIIMAVCVVLLQRTYLVDAPPTWRLLLPMLAGGLVYVAAIFVINNELCREVVGVVQSAFGKRR